MGFGAESENAGKGEKDLRFEDLGFENLKIRHCGQVLKNSDTST